MYAADIIVVIAAAAALVFPDLRVSAALPAFTRTTVRLDPADAGEFGFACGMNTIHGTLIVEPAAAAAGADGAAPAGQDQAAAAPGSGRPSSQQRAARDGRLGLRRCVRHDLGVVLGAAGILVPVPGLEPEQGHGSRGSRRRTCQPVSRCVTPSDGYHDADRDDRSASPTSPPSLA